MSKQRAKISTMNIVLMGFATVILVLVIYLAYCTVNDINIPILDKMIGSSQNTNSADSKSAKSTKPTDLTGTWKSNEKDTYQEATITEDKIVINWISSDSKALFWEGTYTPPKEATNNYTWESKADHKVTDTALLASQEDKKEFTYKDGIISYEASAMGVSKTVKLEKVK